MKPTQTIDEWIQESEENKKAFFREEFILDVTEAVCEHMEEHGINRAQLAERLGKSKSMVSQLLNGYRNMTLGTLADIAYALDLKVKVRFGDDEHENRCTEDDVVPSLPLSHFEVSDGSHGQVFNVQGANEQLQTPQPER